MSSNNAYMEETLVRLNDLNAVMKRMAELDRIPVSEACKLLIDYIASVMDPLLDPEQAGRNPYLMTKPKGKKKSKCCLQ